MSYAKWAEGGLPGQSSDMQNPKIRRAPTMAGALALLAAEHDLLPDRTVNGPHTVLRSVLVLAWRARNLLELWVWAKYFAKDEESARRLYEDAGRDALDTLVAFEKWTAASEPLKEEKLLFLKRASNEGIASLEGGYKRVAEAATDCALNEYYAFYNKLLSKFAHPTATQILGTPDKKTCCFRKATFSPSAVSFS
jgi:hypothetical protein